MSETIIREICDSKFPHHPMTVIDKDYYQKTNGKLTEDSSTSDNAIICSECISPWIQDQSRIITAYVIHWITRINEQVNRYQDGAEISGPFEDGINLSFSDKIGIIDYMIPVFDPSNPYIYLDLKYCKKDGVEKYNLHLGISDSHNFNVILDLDVSTHIIQNDLNDYIQNLIESTLNLFISMSFIYLPEDQVQMIISALDAKYTSSAATDGCQCEHTSADTTDIDYSKCAVCGAALTKPYYIYQNAAYCIDDMYAIVVEAAVKNNLSEIVGLAAIEEPPIHSNPNQYATTPEFKMSVIDKYFNYMIQFQHMYLAYKVV